jgi:preprotein translocase SecE subunit
MTSKSKRFSPFKAISAYFVGSLEEFHKITWPTKEQAAMLTGIVVAVSLVMGLVIGAFDLGLSQAYQALLDQVSAQ